MVAEPPPEAKSGEQWSLVFTYGTLKRGFSNHGLLQDLIRSGDAAFVGASATAEPYPLVCGPYRVPFLLNLPGAGHPAAGELYSVSPRALAHLDDLEGVARGHYERLPLCVSLGAAHLRAEAYFAHRSYAARMWRRSGEVGFRCYSEKEALGYVRRKDRPQNLTFLQQIDMFVSCKLDC